MLMIRPMERNDAAIRPISDKVLCSETVMLQISRTGFTLSYMPDQNAAWRVFPADERAADALDLQGERSVLLGAFMDDRFIGAAVVQARESGWADVLDIRVDASYRRLGTGRALLDAAASFAGQRGMGGLHAAVPDRNPAVCQFLEHCGFRVGGMDRMACAMTAEERRKPLMQRACLLHFYRTNEKG